jgi:hypothetical protein
MPKPQLATSQKADERDLSHLRQVQRGNFLHGTTYPYPLADRRLKREWSPTLPGIPAS